MTKHVTHFIAGKRFDGIAERTGPIFDPATGAVSGAVDFAAADEVDLAVAAARDAFEEWGQLAAPEADPRHVRLPRAAALA